MSNFDIQFRLQSEVVNPVGGLVYGEVVLKQWTDVTGNPLLSQFSRLNSQLGAQPTYYLLRATAAQVLAGTSIQVVGLIDGVLVNDAGLGGDLFTVLSILEQAAGGFPADVLEAAVSAVHNITVHAVGHYTFQINRTDHGAKIIHLDVEAI